MTLWEQRDLPVLAGLANTNDGNVRAGVLVVGPNTGRESLGVDITEEDLELSVLTLMDAGYVAGERSPGLGFTHFHVTGRGMQALGRWPSFTEHSPATIAALLERLAEEAPTAEETNNATRAAAYVRRLPSVAITSAMRTVMVEGARAALRLAVG